LVKLFAGGQLVKTHPRQRPGGRSTDPADLPVERAGDAVGDLSALIGVCTAHGENIGIYAERLLDDPLPWTRMRAVYRLLGLVRRYGPGPVETACSRSLDLDVGVQRFADALECAGLALGNGRGGWYAGTPPLCPGLSPPPRRHNLALQRGHRLKTTDDLRMQRNYLRRRAPRARNLQHAIEGRYTGALADISSQQQNVATSASYQLTTESKLRVRR